MYTHKCVFLGSIPVDSRQNLDTLLLADDKVYYY